MKTQVMRDTENCRRGTQRAAICEHSSTEHLGVNKAVTFLRCQRCDHVLVLHEGRVAGELPRPALSQEAVMRMATGGEPSAASG